MLWKPLAVIFLGAVVVGILFLLVGQDVHVVKGPIVFKEYRHEKARTDYRPVPVGKTTVMRPVYRAARNHWVIYVHHVDHVDRIVVEQTTFERVEVGDVWE